MNRQHTLPAAIWHSSQAILLLAAHLILLGLVAPQLPFLLMAAFWPDALPHIATGCRAALGSLLVLLLLGWHYRTRRSAISNSRPEWWPFADRLMQALAIILTLILLGAWLLGTREWFTRPDARSSLPFPLLIQIACLAGLAALWPQTGAVRLRQLALLIAVLSLLFATFSQQFGWHLDYESWIRHGMP
ncbi:hypothetical protein [Chitinilyticum aquatile]|uniref:hypothetical protein n=1 Tax=Chitinilyticum aquatile TaxID=362520 RepID=UPI000427A7ED|nr:hypothetical protein [Chitinilyticum aquatile]